MSTRPPFRGRKARTGIARALIELARNAGLIAGMALLYYGAARLGLLLAFPKTNASPVWPPSGLAMAAAVLLGNRIYPGIWLGAFLANAAVFSADKVAEPPTVLLVSGLIGVGNTLEALTGALFYRRWVMGDRFMERAKDVVRFMGVALLMCVVGASIGPTTLCLTGVVPWGLYGTIWFTWWLGDVIGVLVVTPALLLIKPRRPWRLRERQGRWFEAFTLLAGLMSVSLLIFGKLGPIGPTHLPLEYLIIPLVVWAAFRFGPKGVALSILVVSVIAVWGTVNGSGPFARGPLSSGLVNQSLLLLQAFLGVVASTGLILAAVLVERKRAEQGLRSAHDDLERQIVNRTAELVTANEELRTEIAERKRLEHEVLQISEREQERIAQELHDGLCQHLTGTAWMSRALANELAKNSSAHAERAAQIASLINQAVIQTREVARGLALVEVEMGNLIAALTALASNVNQFFPVSCTVSCERRFQVDDPAVAKHLYRIAQEAVNNAIKHGRAKHVEIGLSYANDRLAMTIQDDGVGFSESSIDRPGMGLLSMRYRAGAIGASLEIQSLGQQGTVVRCALSNEPVSADNPPVRG